METASGRRVLQRTFRTELQLRDGRVLEGCVVPYGEAAEVRDRLGPGEWSAPYFEVFEPGAFRKQLRAADKVELVYEHRDDLASSIGIGHELHDEASGLYGTFGVHPGAFGDQALELVRSGILPGFSIDFVDMYRHWKRTAEGTVVRQNCRLRNVSLTRTPAYKSALVLAHRSTAELRAELELEAPPELDEQLERLRAVGITV